MTPLTTHAAFQRRAGAVLGSARDEERLRSRRHGTLVAPVSVWRPNKIFLLAFVPFLVCAAPPPPAEPVQKTAAEEAQEAESVRELMRAGVGEYKKGNLEAAREAFLKAWGIRPHYAIAASLAEVEMALGQYRSTAEHLEYYLSNLPPELSEKRPAAESQLAEARKHLVAVRVTAEPADATIYVDGVAVVPGREVLVEPGAHVLMAEEGSAQSKKALFFAAGESRDVKLEIQTAAPVEAPKAAPVLPAPATAPDDSGAHRPVSVLIGGGALTLVALGIGIGYSIDAASARSDADRFAAETEQGISAEVVRANAQCAPPNGASPPAACAGLHDSIEHSDHSRNIATGAFIASGVLAVGTVVTYLLWPTKEGNGDRARVRVAPWATARGATVVGEF